MFQSLNHYEVKNLDKDSLVIYVGKIYSTFKVKDYYSIFKPLYENNISVDMIVQNVSADNKKTDVTFTIKREDLEKSVNLIKKNSNLKFEKINFDDKVAKVSIVGAGMITHPGVAFKMFKALSDQNINILVISTSEIKINSFKI